MSDSNEEVFLEPCAHCGCDELMIEHTVMDEVIRCTNCPSKMVMHYTRGTFEDLVRLWNTRNTVNTKSKKLLFGILQCWERKGLASCDFEVHYRLTKEDDSISNKMKILKFSSPAWNWQTNSEFLKSAIATGVNLWLTVLKVGMQLMPIEQTASLELSESPDESKEEKDSGTGTKEAKKEGGRRGGAFL